MSNAINKEILLETLKSFRLDGEVISCEELTVKPEPRIYELLLERYALDPSESLFIDDRPENIAAAREKGIHGCLFDRNDPQKACNELRQELL